MTEAKGNLLIIDDDVVLAQRLAQSMTRRGFSVEVLHTLADAYKIIPNYDPEYAVVDLRLEDGNGIDVVTYLRTHAPECRVIMLTAYGNFASAVSAVKAGAIDYLAKPADAEMIERALLQLPPSDDATQDIMTAQRARWEHIQRIYEQTGRNVSETARQLKMHRRTLQRILSKHAPKE
jgi:two-component system, response regulator RegA